MFYRPHARVTLDCGEDLITKQSHKDECDIHNILRQYQRTGMITHIQARQGQFLDLPSDIDFQTSLQLIKQAEDAFAALPAKVRDRFHNDPERFLSAFYDPQLREELREMGLLRNAPPDTPAPPQGAAPAPSTT